MMVYSDVIELISQTYTVSATGDRIPTETSRTVYASVKSVGLKRKTVAVTAGLKIDLRFVIRDSADYDGESIVKHAGKRYNVVSAYENDNHEVELDVMLY